jgi:hypothetical protein
MIINIMYVLCVRVCVCVCVMFLHSVCRTCCLQENDLFRFLFLRDACAIPGVDVNLMNIITVQVLCDVCVHVLHVLLCFLLHAVFAVFV